MNPRHRATGAQIGRSRHLWRRKFAPRTVRARLAVVLAVPSALLVALSVVGVTGQFRKTQDANAAVRAVDLILTTQDLVHSLQRERGLSSGVLGGDTTFRQDLSAQRVTSDSARAALDSRLDAVGGSDATAVRTALGRLGGLGAVRTSVDTARISRTDMLAYYTSAIDALDDASATGASAGQQDTVLRQGLESLQLLGEAKEATALERGTLNGVFAAGSFSNSDYVSFMQIRATKLAALTAFTRIATSPRISDLRAAEQTAQALAAAADEQQVVDGVVGQPLHVAPDAWWSAMSAVVDGLRGVQQAVGADVRDRAGQDRGAAERRLAAYAGAAALMLLLAVVLWLYTIGSIMRPLKTLTAEARSAARRRLPDAVAAVQEADDPRSAVPPLSRSAISGRADEFAEVAAALDDLQATALRLAVEQAVMRRDTSESLAHLARRNQNLVRRQLGFISSLEDKEADPDQLAVLFEVDHLATRVRRTAESLLILTGEHGLRRWSEPIEAVDVLRAAFADVEDYRRVVLRRVDAALVRGNAAGDISHLLAELVENALTFSPPDREVEVQARLSGGEYHIAVVDQGIGMRAEAMALANARLRGEHSFLAAPARDLGHFVVGRLAGNLGARVWLHESPLGGVTARITLPPQLLTEAAQPAVEPGSGPGGTATPVAIPRQVAAIPKQAAALPRVPAAVTAGPDTPLATTKNGLVKRSRTATPSTAPPHRTEPTKPTGPTGPTTPDRSPAEVRAMLNSFRSGIHRTSHEPSGGPSPEHAG